MGEIAEMMLDGTMCAGCGEWLNGGEDGDGYPEYCGSCQREESKAAQKQKSQSDKISGAIATMVIECLEEAYKGKMPKDIGEQLGAQIKGVVGGVYNATGQDLMHDGIRKTIENNKAAQKRHRKYM